jgi:L-carnitine CoA-transferase
MAKKSDIPKFGPLQGVRVAHASQSIAGPFVCQMMAELGADVIWLENSLVMDIARADTGMTIEQDRRNQRNLCLNIPSPEGKEIFLKLMEETDIFVEASKAGQYDKWGLSDDVLWEHNPALVIVHISGYGQSGDPDYIGKPSYDSVGQAFGCLMQMNGFADRPPVVAMPFLGDYLTAYLAANSALASYIYASKTGKGESVDVAQFEAMMRCQLNYPLDELNYGIKFIREGNHSLFRAGLGTYKCKDGEIHIFTVGMGVLKKGLPFLGLEFGSKEFPADQPVVLPNTPGGNLLEEKLVAFCATRTVDEAEKQLSDAGIPCSRIMDYQTAYNHPHYVAREVFTEWDTVDDRHIIGVNVIPRLKKQPGKIWRGAPTIGLDNEDILTDLGLPEEKIQELYDKKVIVKKTNAELHGRIDVSDKKRPAGIEFRKE